MTVVCAAHGADGWYIGSDTRMTIGQDPVRTGEKWIVGEGVAIGVSGHSRVLEILRAERMRIFSDPDPWVMMGKLRRTMLDDGFQPEAEPGPRLFSVSAIIVLPGYGIWHVDGALTPVRTIEKFLAIGSGADHATGAAWAAQRQGPDTGASNAVTMGIWAAIALDGACMGGEPWTAKLG